MIKSLILKGYYEFDVLVNGFCLTLKTVSEEQQALYIKRSFYLSKSESLLNVIEYLSNTIIAINGNPIKPNQVYTGLLNFPTCLILQLYSHYKDCLDYIYDFINKNYDSFKDDNETNIRWELFIHGYKFPEPLNVIQKHWIYTRSYKDKNDSFDAKYSLAKYIVNHIATATIDPKTYINMVRNETHHNIEDGISNEENKNQVNLVKNIFDDLKSQNQTDGEDKAMENFIQRINTPDDHDLIIKQNILNELKNAIRIRKRQKASILRPTVILNNKRILHRQESIIDNEEFVKENKENPYIIDNINYKEILDQKVFLEIDDDEKLKILNEVVAENEEVEVKIKKRTNINIEDFKKKNENRKTLKELIEEKEGNHGKN